MAESVTVVWDGKDFSAVQMAACRVREHGRPCAEVDAGWNLTLAGCPVPVGAAITVTGDGEVSWTVLAPRPLSLSDLALSPAELARWREPRDD